MASSKNLEYKKTAFLSKSNSAFIEEMHMKFVNNDPSLPESWRRYFNEIGDETDVVIKEINGPSWSPAPKKFLTKNDLKIIHLHANNYGDVDKNKDPKVIELSLINSKMIIIKKKFSKKRYPINDLDFKNFKRREDIKVKFYE